MPEPLPASGSAGATVPGTLYVVATPIGNLGDLGNRAREVLGAVSIIAAEDTRHTATLLRACGIATPLVSLHEHNEATRVGGLVERLVRGEDVALVSDAGTPLVSDPGFELVGAALAAGIRVSPVPGASAVIAALSVAGLPTDRFAFEGFLPAKPAARRKALSALAREPRTQVFYEAPHRIAEVLADLAIAFGPQRRATVARELTKRFESLYAGPLGELASRARDDADMSRGEIVIVVAGHEVAGDEPVSGRDTEAMLRILLDELPVAQAAKLAARLTGGKRAELYDLAVQLQRETGGGS